MQKTVTLVLVVLLSFCFIAMPAHAQKGKKGKVEPYQSKSFPPPKLIASLCKTKVDQIMGKIETAPNQYTVYIATLGRGRINAHPATLVKLDSNLWVLGCFASIPQVVMK